MCANCKYFEFHNRRGFCLLTSQDVTDKAFGWSCDKWEKAG